MDKLTPQQIQQAKPADIIQQLLKVARQQGAETAEAVTDSGIGFTVTTRLGEVEKIEHERDKGIAITVYIGNKKGSASSSDLSPASIKDIATAACDIAKFTGEDPCAGLAEAHLMATTIPELDLHHPWDITPQAAVQLATECEAIARQQDQRINNSDGTLVSTYVGNHHYGNTHGFLKGWHWSSHSIDCTLIAQTDNGMQRDGWYSKARKKEKLEDIATIANKAATRTIQRLNARKLSTRQCPVIFTAPVAASLFSAFISAISGGSLYRKASFLLDKIDQKVFSDHIQIHEQPHLKQALGSAPFDNEGLATQPRQLVIDGILQSYVLSSYSARKLGLQPTGNAGGVHNLTIEPGTHDLDGLLKHMDSGLLVTDMIGFGVNQITGDYSRGVSGFWVEHGEIQYPVEEITVAGNLLQMYQHIVQLGNDIDRRGNILTGSVLLENITIAGH